MAIYDRWHKSHAADDEPRCGQHRGKVPATAHGVGKRWQVRWRNLKNEQCTALFDKLAEAEAYDAKKRGELAKGNDLGIKAGKETLAEYALDVWLPGQNHLRPNTEQLYRGHLEVTIIPRLGKYPLRTLKAHHIRTFVTALKMEPSGKTGKPLSAATIHTVVAVLKAVLTTAVDDQKIVANPARKVPLPPIEKEQAEAMPKERVSLLASAVPPRYRIAVLLAALAGMREGECLGVRGHDIDFLRRKISLVQQAQNGELAPLKTKSSRRVVPVDDVLLNEIAQHMKQYPAGPHGVLITNSLGVIAKRNSFGDCWRKAVKAAGLEQGTRFHDLRHFYASVLIQAGVNPKVIQYRMGHSTISETFDTYGHMFPDDEALGRGAFDKLFLEPPDAGSEGVPGS